MGQIVASRRAIAVLSVLAGLLAGILAFSASAFREPKSLPTEIADADFWKMVTDFSEPDGYFRFENFLSNEIEYQSVIPALKAGAKTGGVYMGVGPEQNFTYLIALQPKMAFIIDIRRQNMIELMMYKAVFEMSADRADFVSRLFSRKRPAGLTEKSSAEAIFGAYRNSPVDRDLHNTTLAAIKDRLIKQHGFGLKAEDVSNISYVFSVFMQSGPEMDYTSGGGGFSGRSMPTYADLMTATDRAAKNEQNRSYLATEENYRIVRDLERKNLIVPLVGDFAGPKAVRAVGDYVKSHDTTVTAFYLSNVEQYLFGDGVEKKFYENVGTLPVDASSQFIRTFGPGGGGGFGGSFLFETVTSPIAEDLRAFKSGRIASYYELRSHQ